MHAQFNSLNIELSVASFACFSPNVRELASQEMWLVCDTILIVWQNVLSVNTHIHWQREGSA